MMRKKILKAQFIYYVCYMPQCPVMSESFWIITVFYPKAHADKSSTSTSLPSVYSSVIQSISPTVSETVSKNGDDRSEMTDFNHHWQPEE